MIKMLLSAAATIVLYFTLYFVYKLKQEPEKLADLSDNNPYAESPFPAKQENSLQKTMVTLFLIGLSIMVFSGASQLLFWIPESFGYHSENGEWLQLRHYISIIISLLLTFPIARTIEEYAKQKAWASHRDFFTIELEKLLLLPIDELKRKQQEYHAKEEDKRLEWRRRIMHYRLDVLLQNKIEKYERENKAK